MARDEAGHPSKCQCPRSSKTDIVEGRACRRCAAVGVTGSSGSQPVRAFEATLRAFTGWPISRQHAVHITSGPERPVVGTYKNYPQLSSIIWRNRQEMAHASRYAGEVARVKCSPEQASGRTLMNTHARQQQARGFGPWLWVPRFTPEARAANLAVGDLLKRIAEQKHATPAANRARMAAGAEALDRADSRHHEAASPRGESGRRQRDAHGR
jgi:hypothetical protein